MSLAGAAGACQTTKSPEELAERQKTVLEAQKQLVRTALDEGRAQSAMQSLRELLRQHPDDATLHNLMGLAQLSLKSTDRAIQHLRRAYKLDPTPAIGLNLSSAYIESGDHAKAISLLKSMLQAKAGPKAYPYKERVYHNIGYAYAKQNQLTKAQQWYQEALDENPAFFPAHLELARIYEKTRRPAMAMKAYRQSIDYCHVCFEPVKALATLYMKSGKYTDARLLLMRFSKIEGVTTADKSEAERLLKISTAAGTGAPAKKSG